MEIPFNMNRVPANRLQHIDIAKGIGIIAIVFAHNQYVMKSDNRSLSTLIASFSFNIPIFYFLAGIFFNTSEPFIRTLKKKSDSLLVPYFVTLGAVAFAKFVYQDHFDWRLLLYRVKIIIYSSGGILEPSWQALWFFTSLFVTMLSFKILHVYLLSRMHNTVKGIILFALLLGGYLLIRSDNSYYRYILITYAGLPWSIDLIPIALFYLALGYYLKPFLVEMHNSERMNAIVTASCSLVFISLVLYSGDKLNLYRREYDDFILCTLKAISGIFLILGVSSLLEKNNNVIKQSLSVIGRLSLIIFMFHFVIQKESFEFLSSFLNVPRLYSAILSFLLAIGIPILMHRLVITKNKILQAVYDPSQKKMPLSTAQIK
jgi:fucose 4-O-acetylase-like acetyltransferase